MDKVKVLINKDSEFMFNIVNKNIDLESEGIKKEIKYNSVVDYEKGIYKNRKVFNMNMFFYLSTLKDRDSSEIIDDGYGDIYRLRKIHEDKFTTSFGKSLSRLGFVFPEDQSRKNFNKSNVVIEFYSDNEGLSQWLGSEIYPFNELIPFSSERATNYGAEIYNGRNIDVVREYITDPSINMVIGKKFLSEYFGYRDFNSYGTEDSVTLYYKIMIQNAKNGVRYYMLSGKDGAIDSKDYNDEMLYNEMIIYRDKTFEFQNIVNGELNFKELIIT